jgi:hypothetical protein
MTEIIESACEQLQCKIPGALEYLLLLLFVRCILTLYLPGVCLDPVAENRRVSERTTALERVSLDTNTFWVDTSSRRRSCSWLLTIFDNHVFSYAS